MKLGLGTIVVLVSNQKTGVALLIASLGFLSLD